MLQWYALYTKPHKEWQVAELVELAGYDAYLPTTFLSRRDHAQGRRHPYFPCYLFAQLDASKGDLAAVRWLPGLRRIVGSHTGGAWVVDERIVKLIRERLRELEQGQDWRTAGFKQGQRVRITRGPLRDLEAVFDAPMSAEDRVRVLVNIMGRMTPCEVHVAVLEPLLV